MHPFGLLPRRAVRAARSSWLFAAGIGVAMLAWESRGVQADTSPVVAKVGARTITAAELERRLAMVPPFQLRGFGNGPDEIKKNFLERVLVREALLTQGAEARGLAEREDVKEKIRGVARSAMIAKLRAEVAQNEKPNEGDIRAYYEKNAAKFRTPARIGLWQIVVAKREEALDILAELKKDSTPKRWSELARERSLDRASNMRGGNYGFVLPDGTTNDPALKVSPEVLKAASAVKDAELVPEPVKDGDRWAVVWRRQSVAGVDRPVEMEMGSIRQILLHERTEAKIKETLAALRKSGVRENNPDLIEAVEVTGTGDITPVRRPGTMPSGKRPTASPTPAPGSLR
ncbi:Foldase protein PrsA precursor [Minicystis rosea]|nr:Foldase protein PrsA precursor [Minicystis rosea]